MIGEPPLTPKDKAGSLALVAGTVLVMLGAAKVSGWLSRVKDRQR